MNLEKNNLSFNNLNKPLSLERGYPMTESLRANEGPSGKIVEVRLANIALENTGILNGDIVLANCEVLPSDEKLIEKDRNHFGYSIISYFEGAKIIQCFDNYGDYVTSDDLLMLNSPVDSDCVSKLDNLFQFENILRERIKSKNEPSQSEKIDFAELSKYKRNIKTEYLIKFNREISDYITSASKNNNNFKAVRQWLMSELKMASSSNMNSDNEFADLNIRYHDNEKAMQLLYGIVNGMRHEEGFKELLSEMPEDLIDYAESSLEQDSRGVDMILKAKISNEKDLNGCYKYASTDEILANKYKIKCLPVDIKSTKTKAKSCLEKMLQNDRGLNHWIMWSNLLPEDFMLYIDDADEKAKLRKSDDEALLYLGYEQTKAMKNLGYVAYKDKNGNKFKPPTLNSRIDNIKSEVLRGINELYYDAN